LFDYADYTDELNIKPFPKLEKNFEVKSELWALERNYIYLSEAIEAFKGAFASYKTLARQKNRECFDLPLLVLLLQYLARSRLNLGELNEEIAFTESFNPEKSQILENILNLNSAHEILHITRDTLKEIKEKSLTERDDINTSKISLEIIQAIFNNRQYQNMIRGNSTQTKSNLLSKIMNTQRNPKIIKNLPYSSTEYLIKPKHEDFKGQWNSPYFFRNISNIYGESDIEKFRRKQVPKPSHPYFADFELRKAIKLGQKVSKLNSNFNH
jgi:hypothetical protein